MHVCRSLRSAVNIRLRTMRARRSISRGFASRCADCSDFQCVPDDQASFGAVAHLPPVIKDGDLVIFRLVTRSSTYGTRPFMTNSSVMLYDGTPPATGNDGLNTMHLLAASSTTTGHELEAIHT